jgi:hypothetical protein
MIGTINLIFCKFPVIIYLIKIIIFISKQILKH